MFKPYYNAVENEIGVIVYLDPTMNGKNSALFQAFKTEIDGEEWFQIISQDCHGIDINHGYIQAKEPKNTIKSAWAWIWREARDYFREFGEWD